MKIIQHKQKVWGYNCSMNLMQFDKKDAIEWKRIFDQWKKLKMDLKKYKCREPNLPEGLSEVAFCLYSGSTRLISMNGKASSSFDTYNIKTKKAEQIKATSVGKDLTSFGPKSRWDDLYFLDFYNNEKLDGTFNIYKVPTKLVHKVKVKKDLTFLDRQKEGKRPRFSITKIFIDTNKLKPLASNVKVW
ncbi:MAG: Bsp6I family type II restriction endonuclease [bacterium]